MSKKKEPVDPSTYWSKEELDAFMLINRRRRQLHIHSVLYYHMDTNIITDATFDAWAVELAALQKKYPKQSEGGYLPNLFRNWTGDTGMHLPVTDWAYAMAEQLIRLGQKRS